MKIQVISKLSLLQKVVEKTSLNMLLMGMLTNICLEVYILEVESFWVKGHDQFK